MAEKESEEAGELIFLRYAFPAIECCGHKKIDKDEFLEFERMLREGGNPSRERLMQIYPNAVKHLKSWSLEDVRDYWWTKHNKIVEDNPVCKVHGLPVADVFKTNGSMVCKVGAGGNLLFPSYVPLKRGNYFTIHNLVVAEKISEEDYNKFFKK